MWEKNIFKWFVGFRPNNYIMCERLGNFWSLHQYLYSPKRFALFCLLTINFECFTLLQSAARVDGKNEIEDETIAKHLPCGVYGKDNVVECFYSLISHNIHSLLYVVSFYDAIDDAAIENFILFSFYELKYEKFLNIFY